MIQTIAHFFLFSLAFGTQILQPVVGTQLTGVGFYKLTTSIVLTCLVLSTGMQVATHAPIGSLEYGLYALLILTNSLGWALHRDQKSWFMWVLYVTQVLGFSTLAFHLFPIAWMNFFFSSMALLGISNYSMLLGHYYLVVPKLSEEPLIYCLFIFWAVFLLKIVSSIVVILTTAAPYLADGNQIGDGYVYNWLFISMRYVWGYVAPFILSLFTFRLCKLRSLQSATGVLYIVEFFVIVGELISVYLMAKHGLAL